MKKYALLVSVTFILSLLVAQCTRKTTGWGDDSEIYILADSTIWQDTASILKEIFEKDIITPQYEKIFVIQKTTLDKFKRFKNLLFVATLEDSGSVSELVKTNLSPEARQRVENGSAFAFTQKDKWASHQFIMFLVSTNIEALKQRIIQDGDNLFRLFDDHWNEVQEKQLFISGEQVDLEKQLLKRYGWTVRVPRDYKIFIENADSHFVMLRQTLPERWFFIYWIDTFDPLIIDKDWCIAKRNALGNHFYNGDQIEQQYSEPEIEEVNFLGHRAVYISGLWRNDQKQSGGPFRNYCFYDENSQRIYMLDYSLFQPRLKKPKKHLLRQAEILLHTFRTQSDISVPKP